MPLLFFLLSLLFCTPLLADNGTISAVQLPTVQQVFPAAERLGEVSGPPHSRPVYAGDELLGYVLLSDQVKPIPAYSGQPISALIGIDPQARIAGVTVLDHEEPILVIGVTEAHLARFTSQYQGVSALDKVRIGAQRREGYTGIDGISGATITVMVLNRSIMQAAAEVVAFHNLPRSATAAASGAATASAAQPTASAAQAAQATPVWQELWLERDWRVLVLILALVLLLFILFFQDWLVKRTKLFYRVRVAYLLFTVFFIGFYCLAQLSIVNILAFIQVLTQGFTWETLMIEPFIFLLWSFVAISILLWGRGVFCGWLCPYGAAQELIHKAGEKVGLKQFEFPPMVHERLWAVKYLILVALVGVSLESMATASKLAEVEPFKTAFVLQFHREWGYVLWAAGLLVISAFNSKFFCKYLCPLGASLSFATRFRIFDWLRRRKECGRPCQTCAKQCQIGAIKPTGEIIDNECHYCLECQVTYWDDQRCPPLVERRKRREKRQQRASTIATDRPSDAA